MLKRLRIKFVCINMIIVTIMLGVIFGTVLHFTQRNLEQQSIRTMPALAVSHGRPSRPGVSPEQMQLPYFVLRLDSSGQLLETSGGYYDLSDEDFLNELIDIVATSDERIGVIPEYNLRFSWVGTPKGQNVVFVDMSMENSIMANLLRNCYLIGLGSFLMFLLISLLLARWAVKPVEQAWQQQRQFVADASHELKTPLTIIITNAEFLQNPNYDDAAKAGFSGSILTMAQQMRELVEGLLELARVDNGSSKTAFSDVNISQLVSDSILPFEPLYFEKELCLQEQIEAEIKLKGSRAHLKQIPEILLDNAMKYAFPQSTVYVRLKKQGYHCVLSVSNAGHPIPHEDLKNIFKRFYRADKARSRTGSYGLGLAIAEGIVKDHGGKIWAESQDGMNTFFVQLPL